MGQEAVVDGLAALAVEAGQDLQFELRYRDSELLVALCVVPTVQVLYRAVKFINGLLVLRVMRLRVLGLERQAVVEIGRGGGVLFGIALFRITLFAVAFSGFALSGIVLFLIAELVVQMHTGRCESGRELRRWAFLLPRSQALNNRKHTLFSSSRLLSFIYSWAIYILAPSSSSSTSVLLILASETALRDTYC